MRLTSVAFYMTFGRRAMQDVEPTPELTDSCLIAQNTTGMGIPAEVWDYRQP